MLGTQDLDVFFNPDEFATPATISGAVGSKLISVLFDEVFDPTYMSPMFDFVYERAGAKAESRSLSAMCKSADVAGFHHNDTLTLNGKTYKIVGITPQQDGNVTVLELKA